jgi:hypothetical protein
MPSEAAPRPGAAALAAALAAARQVPPPRVAHVFDGGGNLLASWASGGGVGELPLPVASLLASIQAFAADGGLRLERVELEHCSLSYTRCGMGGGDTPHGGRRARAERAACRPRWGPASLPWVGCPSASSGIRHSLELETRASLATRGPGTGLLWVVMSSEEECAVASAVEVRTRPAATGAQPLGQRLASGACTRPGPCQRSPRRPAVAPFPNCAPPQAADALLLSALGPSALDPRQPLEPLKRRVKGGPLETRCAAVAGLAQTAPQTGPLRPLQPPGNPAASAFAPRRRRSPRV